LGQSGKEVELAPRSSRIRKEVVGALKITWLVKRETVILGSNEEIKENIEAAKENQMSKKATIGKFL
jgi:hypothetical protein